MSRATPPASDASPEQVDLLGLGRMIWGELPLMTLISLLVTLLGSMTAVVVLSISVLAPTFAAVTLGPIWLGAIAVADRLLDGDAVGFGDLIAETRRWARAGLSLAMVPAVVATLFVGSVGILGERPAQRWLLLPIALDATALIVITLGCVYVFPLVVTSRLRGRGAWTVAVTLAGRDLTTTLGVASLLVLLALSTRLFGPILALLLAGPVAVLCTAVTRRAVARTTLGRRP